MYNCSKLVGINFPYIKFSAWVRVLILCCSCSISFIEARQSPILHTACVARIYFNSTAPCLLGSGFYWNRPQLAPEGLINQEKKWDGNTGWVGWPENSLVAVWSSEAGMKCGRLWHHDLDQMIYVAVHHDDSDRRERYAELLPLYGTDPHWWTITNPSPHKRPVPRHADSL